MDVNGYLFVFLVYFFNANEIHAAPGNIYKEYAESCAPLFTPEVSQHKCNSYMTTIYELMDQCKKDMMETAWTCEDSMCMLSTQNLLGGDGVPDHSVNEAAVQHKIQIINRLYPRARSVMDRIQTTCLEGKYNMYHPGEECSPLKYQICVSAVWFVGFLDVQKDWAQTDECQRTLEMITKCNAALETLSRNSFQENDLSTIML